MAALILLDQMFMRRAPSALRGVTPDDADCVETIVDHVPTSHQPRSEAEPHDTGVDLRGSLRADLRPPTELLSSGTSQLVAFLIRNRGRLDNPVVRSRWAQLDRVSLPLAIHLRRIEADGAWDVLRREISVAPLAKLPAKVKAGSIRHLRILALIPEWVQRGEELLTRWEPEVGQTPALDQTSEQKPVEQGPML